MALGDIWEGKACRVTRIVLGRGS